ncbi:low molecular weight phosphotyrosine protein phosphatase [Calidifontibacter sp. DB0510]|uniref:protein-tyrosine-phosphatase n=1 Tax=Metallococcus carri TaxID=1656884 RepID=A0A967EBR4_9MICO|nr:low molecular weight protein-tyrosine-phosphatase [Metallococcus carri]NHN57244.1 low molecular weight phosphotyrosine protein phosphatase [Metallococcus carri]NOP37953.1 low molecular weight phosphotyrosine protein phosphatase [Calidifontibacter sp. DB2511S]
MTYRVCFLCSGNICRSPMGEIILRSMLADAGLAGRVEVDSAGTGDWHVGDGADPRTIAELKAAGYDGSAHRASQLDAAYLTSRDLILAADEGHLRRLRSLARGLADHAELRLVREFDPDAVAAGTLELDDPWYGDEEDFRRCRREVEAACRGLVDRLRSVV